MSKVKRVVLVPGHDFVSQGCSTRLKDCSVKGGKLVTEYNIVTRLVTEVFREEELRNIDLVVKGRNTLTDLPDEINTLNADYVISCHLNAFNGKAQGTEVLYAKGSNKGKALAEEAQEIFVKHLGLASRGTKAIGHNERGGHVLLGTLATCILIEPFFLDAYSDEDKLEDAYQKMKDGLKELIVLISKK